MHLEAAGVWKQKGDTCCSPGPLRGPGRWFGTGLGLALWWALSLLEVLGLLVPIWEQRSRVPSSCLMGRVPTAAGRRGGRVGGAQGFVQLPGHE